MNEVVARNVLQALAAHLHDLARGQDGLQAQDIVPRDSVLDGAAPSGIFGEVAPDEAGLEAHGVARIEKPELLDRLADLAGHNAGLHDGHHVFPVDLQDPVHPLEGEHDPPVEGHGPAGKPRPASAGGYGDTVPVGAFHDFRDLAGRGGLDDGLGHAGILSARHLVMGVVFQKVRILENEVIHPHDGLQLFHDLPGHRLIHCFIIHRAPSCRGCVPDLLLPSFFAEFPPFCGLPTLGPEESRNRT